MMLFYTSLLSSQTKLFYSKKSLLRGQLRPSLFLQILVKSAIETPAHSCNLWKMLVTCRMFFESSEGPYFSVTTERGISSVA